MQNNNCADCGGTFIRKNALQTRCRECHLKKPERKEFRNKMKRLYTKRRGSYKLWQKRRAECFKRDGCCVICKTVDNLTIDHIKPLSHGGKTHIDNLRVLCKPCHTNVNKGIINA